MRTHLAPGDIADGVVRLTIGLPYCQLCVTKWGDYRWFLLVRILECALKLEYIFLECRVLGQILDNERNQKHGLSDICAERLIIL